MINRDKAYLKDIFQIIKGDITTLPVDAIVNSAHPSLLAGSGVCGAIHLAAGKQLETACRKIIGGCKPGEAIVTEGYNLQAKYVIHTVAPHGKVYGKLTNGDKKILIDCYKNTIYAANHSGFRTLAFPSIGTGVRGFPIEDIAKLMVTTIADYLDEYVSTAFDKVYIVLHSNTDYQIYKRAYDAFF